MKKKSYAVVACMLLLLGIVFAGKEIKADTATTTKPKVKVNYEEEMLVIEKPSVLEKKIYISTDKKKSWDRIEWDATADAVYFDISSVLSGREVSVFVGNSTTDESQMTEVVLAKQEKVKAKASGASIVITEIPAGREVEYRKGDGSVWTVATTSAISKSYLPKVTAGTNQLEVDFSAYALKGAKLTFRLKATETQRVGKEVKAKVAKRANAPNIKLDGTKLSLSGFKANGSEYRLDDKTGWVTSADKVVPASKIWGADTSTRSIPMGVTNAVSVAGISCPMKGGTVEVRTAAAKTKPASRSKIVEVTSQAVFLDASKVSVKVMAPKSKSSTTSRVAISISDASSTNVYEYTMVNPALPDLDVSIMKWNAIKSSKDTELKAVKYGSSTINPGTNMALLIRKKSVTDKQTKVVYMASTCIEYLFDSATSGKWVSGSSVTLK